MHDIITGMSVHAYSRCWVHIVWTTYQRQPILTKESAIQISNYLYEYAKSKDIFMKVNYVNKDHVHVLVDLPRHMSLEEAVKLLKGSSSYWINQKSFLPGKFNWNRGYAGFSVAQSTLKKTIGYITSQEERHKVKTFNEEFQGFLKAYQLENKGIQLI